MGEGGEQKPCGSPIIWLPSIWDIEFSLEICIFIRNFYFNTLDGITHYKLSPTLLDLSSLGLQKFSSVLTFTKSQLFLSLKQT